MTAHERIRAASATIERACDAIVDDLQGRPFGTIRTTADLSAIIGEDSTRCIRKLVLAKRLARSHTADTTQQYWRLT